jgi:hypothetical protein
MPATKEFTVLMDDRPSTPGRFCRALADREVNILALQSFPIGGKRDSIHRRQSVDRQDGAGQRAAEIRRGRNRPSSTSAPIRRNRASKHPVWERPTSTSITHTAAWSPVRIRLSSFLASRKSARLPRYLSTPQPPQSLRL